MFSRVSLPLFAGRRGQRVNIPVSDCLPVYFKRLLFPPGVQIASDILLQSPIDGGPSELVADYCCGQALAKCWERV